MNLLSGKVAVVTGASRGIGRGIALQLGSAGAKVYITGRRPEQSLSNNYEVPTLEKTAQEIRDRGGEAVVVYTDHTDMSQVKALFEQIDHENNGALDILVNNAFAAVKTIAETGEKMFWEQDPETWDMVNNVGLRNHYFCCVFAARLMTQRQPTKGLIINVSSIGGVRYCFNVPYGVGKEALDRMSSDMGIELDPFKITVISLWPGSVKTEIADKLLERNELNFKRSKEISEEATQNILKTGESIEFAGKIVVKLAADPKVHRFNKKTLMTADLASIYKVVDVDGRHILSPRSIKYALTNKIISFPGSQAISNIIPSCLKIPGWTLHLANNRL